MTENLLYYGDNLDVLRRHVKDESVDLVYLDPPFNSSRNYNVLFAEQDGTRAASQMKAFEDTWRWDSAAAAAYEEVVEGGGKVSQAMQSFRLFLGDADMLAYLSMMAPRLMELRRVLKPTGSLYLHCDPTASHYLKLLLDAVFGPENFKNDISWKRTTTKSDYRQGATNWPRVHDVLLYYRKDADIRGGFNQPFSAYSVEYVAAKYRHRDSDGRPYMLDKLTAPGSGSRGHPLYELLGIVRHWVYNKAKMEQLVETGRVVQSRPGTVPRYKRYLDEVPGIAIGDVWDNISAINSMAQERLGYPTQKPEALLERIIAASSNEGDTILDPFCGCGTTIAAAQKLGRGWIGIDVTHLAIGLIKTRLRDAYGDEAKYKVIGEPTTVDDAAELAKQDQYQFQAWALGLVGARPAGAIKKGADKGIDGRLYFHDGSEKSRQIVISVKSGKLHAVDVRELPGVLSAEGADIAVLISFEKPTQQMRSWAAGQPFYESAWGKHPRLQLLTIEELLDGKGINYPRTAGINRTYKQAPRALRKVAEPSPGFFDKNDS